MPKGQPPTLHVHLFVSFMHLGMVFPVTTPPFFQTDHHRHLFSLLQGRVAGYSPPDLEVLSPLTTAGGRQLCDWTVDSPVFGTQGHTGNQESESLYLSHAGAEGKSHYAVSNLLYYCLFTFPTAKRNQ